MLCGVHAHERQVVHHVCAEQATWRLQEGCASLSAKGRTSSLPDTPLPRGARRKRGRGGGRGGWRRRAPLSTRLSACWRSMKAGWDRSSSRSLARPATSGERLMQQANPSRWATKGNPQESHSETTGTLRGARGRGGGDSQVGHVHEDELVQHHAQQRECARWSRGRRIGRRADRAQGG